MSACLDSLLGAERLADCIDSDAPEITASVSRVAPDVLVFNLGAVVALEPQNDRAEEWLAAHIPQDTQRKCDLGYVIERHTWPSLSRAARIDGIAIS